MKVILLKDVAKVGLRHEEVDISNGYALNKLIPQNLAVAATPENRKKLEQDMRKRVELNESMKEVFTTGASKLEGNKLTISVSANDKGHLFEALKVSKLIETAKAEGVELLEDMVIIDSPIKDLGEHTVYLTNGIDKKPFTIVVEKE